MHGEKGTTSAKGRSHRGRAIAIAGRSVAVVTEKTERGNETVERTFEKFDTKAAREMANLLKELMEIKGERAVGESAAGVIVLPESGMEEEP